MSFDCFRLRSHAGSLYAELRTAASPSNLKDVTHIYCQHKQINAKSPQLHSLLKISHVPILFIFLVDFYYMFL